MHMILVELKTVLHVKPEKINNPLSIGNSPALQRWAIFPDKSRVPSGAKDRYWFPPSLGVRTKGREVLLSTEIRNDDAMFQ